MALEPVIDVIISLKNEMVIFVLAIIVHALFYGNILPRNFTSSKKLGFGPSTRSTKTQAPGNSDQERTVRMRPDGYMPAVVSPSFRSPPSKQDTLLEIERAHESGDVRAVLQCWNRCKNSENMELEPQHVIIVVQSMKRLRIDSDSIARSVHNYLKYNVSKLGNVNYVNEILESVAKSLDTSLVDSLVQGLEEMSIKLDSKTFEILIQMHFSVRSFKDIEALGRRMEAEGIQPTARTSLSLLKTALHKKELNAVLRHYASFQGASATLMPEHLEVQVLELASREGSEEVLNSLLRGATEDPSAPQLGATGTMGRPQVRWAVADLLLLRNSRTEPMHPSTFSALLCFYSEAGQLEKVCDVYIKHLRPQVCENITRSLMDAQTRTNLINAALTCSKHEIVAEILSFVSKVVKVKCIDTIRVRLAKGDVEVPAQFKLAMQIRGHGCQN